MKKRTFAAILAAAIAVSALVTAGCGEDKKESSSETETTTVSQASESRSETETEAAEQKAKTTTNVNLRSGPGTDYDILSTLASGTVVTVISEESGWTKVTCSGQDGYISSEYLTLISGGEASSVAETESATTAAAATAASTASSNISSTVTPNIADDGSGNLRDLGLFDLTGLSNKSIPFGITLGVDENNNGTVDGIEYYESLYGKYNGVYRIKTDQKLLYLTMDEGYEAGYTPTILDILKEKNVHAVFFITKQFYDSNPELIQRMIDEGHTIGNHTCLHPSGGYPVYVDSNGLESFTSDVEKLHKMVYDSFGYSMKLFRFPEGESSELTMAALNNIGYTPVFWDFAHTDYNTSNQPDPTETLQKCLTNMFPGEIYLLHAVSSSNTAALADFIDQARAQGYEFGDFPVEEVSAK